MKVLVTGGAGFIGRWVVKRLMELGHEVWILDDLSNGRIENIKEFEACSGLKEFIQGDIKDKWLVSDVFKNAFDVCYHLGASINVQDSLDRPEITFNNDVAGTFVVLEECRKHGTKIVFMSTCMVYDMAVGEDGIKEDSSLKPASPYAACKISGENLVLSYFHSYGLPAVVVRPFNTYGPFQKTGGEGGVVSIFIKLMQSNKDLNIYGDGTQTRDLLYVEDCADFVVSAGFSDAVNGEIVNAGSGCDISINDLALLICPDTDRIKHVTHIHPQSEIKKLLCNFDKAERLLGFKPKIMLEEGLKRTTDWIKDNMEMV